MSLVRHTSKKIAQGFFVIIISISIIFFLINLAPGDPIQFVAGDPIFLSKELVDYYRKMWGLDKPLYERFLIYLSNVFLRGDLGYSYRYSAPVIELIKERLPVTLLLTVVSNVLAFILGVALGLYASRKYTKLSDNLLSLVSFILNSTPTFLLGIVLMLAFSIHLKIFPVSGLIDVRNPKTGFMYYFDILYHSVLPIATLTFVLLPMYFKVVRDTALQQLGEDYVILCRAIGLDEGRIFKKHIFRNSILPPITLFMLQLGYSVAGAAITETVFGWPGVGRLLLDAIYQRDYPVILGVYLLVSISIVALSIIADLVYTILDPRIKTGGAS
ncbi:MAG: hypothetical protein B7O98_09445 [Zestosphaera tikiterensis]|uniref:ABC transmembrane type-1 domain-containing protein n=1 Tax=Zestosphaera tikiterensis TaxID=1973259 RepID=A0A2R7Y1F5_9CREN|nr:MAG: hypothetical protein B7O98_09445 [Zestosphaera tikiterensis]